MSLFHRKTIRFTTPDPLANGLADEIDAERKEADAFRTLDDMPAEELVSHWNAIVEDIKKDPDWSKFSNE
ncbi:MAG: hypothetical protein WAW80_02470 [Candidatus Saccharimonadales bacterium]